MEDYKNARGVLIIDSIVLATVMSLQIILVTDFDLSCSVVDRIQPRFTKYNLRTNFPIIVDAVLMLKEYIYLFTDLGMFMDSWK